MLQGVSLKLMVVFLFGFIVSYKEAKSSSDPNFLPKGKVHADIQG